MEGVLHESQNFIEYSLRLFQEYAILDSAQLYSLLKRYANLDKKPRERLVRQLRTRGILRKKAADERFYYAKSPQIKLDGKYKAQVKCFWILLQYIGKVDSHNAKGSFSRITMEIDGRDYDIAYVPKGAERFCVSHMEKAGAVRFFLVIEEESQISLIHGDKIHTFATVSAEGQIKYYSAP